MSPAPEGRQVDPRLALIPDELRGDLAGSCAGSSQAPDHGAPRVPRSRDGHAPLGNPSVQAGVERMRGLTPILLTVPEASRRLLAAVASDVPVTGAFVLLPDDEGILAAAAGWADRGDSNERVWRVADAVGLRRLERRLQVGESHWLVREAVERGRSVTITNSDIVRARLAGLPLSSRRHIMAAPIPEVDGAVVAARDEAAFDEKDVVALASFAEAFVGEISAALAVRALARDLADFVDFPD